jgi:uncharacterized protein (DUF58 family)
MKDATGLRLQQNAEGVAAALPPLLVAAERVASTVAQGVHGRRRVGQGETFWQFREYETGDSPQSIDWRQTAKTDRVFVREMEWEAAQSVWLWRDASPSMNWRSDRALPSKRERADLLLLALVVLLVRAGERVTLLGSGRPPSSGKAVVSRLAVALDRAARETAGESEKGGGSEAAAGSQAVGASGLPETEDLPRHAEVIFFGDFLAPLEEIETRLRHFAERGLHGHVVQILDPAEASLPYRGRVRFEGLEGEQPWLLSKVETVRQAYVARLERQREGLTEIARSLGWTASLHHTDSPPQAALLSAYSALSHGLAAHPALTQPARG